MVIAQIYSELFHKCGRWVCGRQKEILMMVDVYYMRVQFFFLSLSHSLLWGGGDLFFTTPVNLSSPINFAFHEKKAKTQKQKNYIRNLNEKGNGMK